MEHRTTTVIPYDLYSGLSDGSKVRAYGFQDDHLLQSINNPRVNGRYTSGGPFYVRHRLYTYSYVNCDWRQFGVTSKTSPGVGVTVATRPVPNSRETQFANMALDVTAASGYGATGWARTRPGNPTASVAQFIGESKDFLPSLPGKIRDAVGTLLHRKAAARRTPGLKGLGDAYLNANFGWVPLLGDIQKMYHTYQNIDKQLAQIVRDNGNGVHRSTVLKEDTTVSVISDTKNGSFPFVGFQRSPPNWTGGWSHVTETRKTTDKIWYVGKYRYYIPDIGTSQWTKRATRALYGANLTPEVAWNLIPWTWLTDWFTNVGDIMSNMSSNAVDNLTADYAYVMRTISDETTYTGDTHWDPKGSPSSDTWIPGGGANLVAVSKTETKLRVGASPFGFGVKFDGLSPYQLGIAAALGISRW